MAVDNAYTKTILHFNGIDGSTTLTDESGRVWSASGNAQLDTAQAVTRFGTSNLLLNGSTDYIFTNDYSGFAFGTDDLTIDFRIRLAALPAASFNYYDFFKFGTIQNGIKCDINNTMLTVRTSSGNLCYVAHGFSALTWYHIAVIRTGGYFLVYKNGVLLTSSPDQSYDSSVLSTCYIGTGDNGTYNGWIDEFRVSKGIARWTSNFTPPVAEYSAVLAVSSFLPSFGIEGTSVVITGTEFTGATSVTFGGTEAACLG